MNEAQLISIRDTIEKMSKFNQIEALRLLKKHESVTINENKYGIHINLSELDPSILAELEQFSMYIKTQEAYLDDTEKEKEKYKQFFTEK